MERPSVDGGCGAVYPHGALHAPVRAPDGELEDGPEGKRCSSSTMVFPLAPCRVTFVSMRYPYILTGWGRQGEPCTTIPSISSIGCVRETSFFFFLRRSISQRKRVFSLKRDRNIYMHRFIISFRTGLEEICSSSLYRRSDYPDVWCIPDIRLTVDGIH